MSMHPDDRPSDTATFADALFGTGALPNRAFVPGLRRANLSATRPAVHESLVQDNLILAVFAAVLLTLAFVLTVFSPVL